jgi:hypothetical protein
MPEDLIENLVMYWVRTNWKYVYSQTPQVMQQLNTLIGAQNDLCFVLSEEKGHEDPVTILSLEIEADIQASMLLAMSGFYRHANIPLRSLLALAFSSVWFSFNRAEFQQWWGNDPKAPFTRDDIMRRQTLKELVNKSYGLKKAEADFDLVETCMELYEQLSKFVHATGRDSQDISSRNDSVPHFYPEQAQSWLTRLQHVFEKWVVVAFARYPDLLDTRRHPKEKEHVLSAISSDGRRKLENLAQISF